MKPSVGSRRAERALCDRLFDLGDVAVPARVRLKMSDAIVEGLWSNRAHRVERGNEVILSKEEALPSN